MRKFAVYIFPFLAIIATVLLVHYYKSDKTELASDLPLSYPEAQEQSTTVTPVEEIPSQDYETPTFYLYDAPTIKVPLTYSDCIETSTETCYVSSATGLTFAYPRKLGTLTSKTRYEYLHYGESEYLDRTDYHCMYEDIESTDGSFMISLEAGGIGNGNCFRSSGSDYIAELEFYNNSNKVGAGRVIPSRGNLNSEDQICKIYFWSSFLDKSRLKTNDNLRTAYVNIQTDSFDDTMKMVMETVQVDLNNANPANFDTVNTIDFENPDNPNNQAVRQYYLDNGFIKMQSPSCE